MSEIRIREARAEDDVAVGEILVEAFTSMYAKEMPEVVYDDQRKSELRATAEKRKVAQVFVAEENGVVVGTVTVWPSGSRGSEAFESGAFDLRHLAVASGHRGKNVSTLLLNHTEAWSKAKGAPGICLHVRRGVKGVADLYMSRGYQRRPDGDLELPTVSLEGFFLQL